MSSNNQNVLGEAFFVKFGIVKFFRKEQIIIEPGIEPSGVFYIKKGFVRLYTITKDGKELTYNIYKPGMYFPMTWAIAELPNIYFLETLSDVEVLRVPKEKVIEYLKENSEVLFDLTKRAFSGLEGITKLMDALLSKNAYHQVCAIVLMLTKRFGKTDGENNIIIEVPLTHRILGTLAGLSREATSRELEKLNKEKIICTEERKIKVLDISKLEEEFSSYSPEYIQF